MEEQKKQKKKLNIISRGHTDIMLLFVIFFLMAFGVVMVYSSSYYYSYKMYGDPTRVFMKQMIWVVVGTVMMLVVSRFNYRLLVKLAPLLYIGMIVLLAVVLLMPAMKGSKRWILIGGFQFQPSEIAKVTLIMVLAWLCDGFKDHIDKNKVLFFIIGLCVVPIGMIGVENLSTAIVTMAIVGGIFFTVYRNIPKLVLFSSPLLGLAFLVLFKFEGYRSSRVQSWLEGPFSDPTGKGFQTIQSLYAIGSGGFFGVGLGKSIQKMDSLPEAHNDIIFSIICEELGLFGALSIIMVFGLLVWRLTGIVQESKGVMPMVVVIGVLVHISTQVFINIAVVTNTIPATGIPLPFISYGGSSLIFLLVEMGLVLNIARENNRRIEK